MRLPRSLLVTLVLGGLAACGPSPSADDTGDDGDGGGPAPDAYTGPRGKLSGNVWMPMHSPTLAPSDPIPVYGAVVYVSNVRPDPIPQNVFCERCVDAPASAVYTAHDGAFELDPIPGDYWLVIQKGQWRLEQQITVGESEIVLTDAQTTLPHDHDPANGAYIPKVGIVLGTNDNIEDVLGKVGFDSMNGNDFVDVPGMEVTVFTSASQLIGSLDTLRQFHIVFFPCNTGIDDFGVPELSNQTALDNLRRYVNEGGKLYVTDWSGEVMDRPFPPQITLGDSGADSTGTYDPINFGGTITTAGDSNGSLYTSNDAEAIDPNLNAWLGLQVAPTPSNPTPSQINPDLFEVQGNWNWITALAQVQTGMDPEGLPIYDDPKAWVIGSGPATGGAKKPLSVTFEPTGCGRVLFSTYQTANGNHAGLHPQERVLLFLIMEIGVCSDVPIVD
jgi:hypothetical protein